MVQSPWPRDKVFSSVVFPMPALAKLSEDQYRSALEGSDIEFVALDPNETIEDRQEFELEKHLEDFIVSNFDAIFKGQMRLFEDTDGNDGQQYQTDIGQIDILAFEPKSSSFVVVELKKGRPSDQVVGQILRYMGWVNQHLCKEGQGVKGLVVCRAPDPKLSYALKMTNNIDVRYYSVSFKLREEPGPTGGVGVTA